MKVNLTGKLWLTESRSVSVWSLGVHVRAHKNSPADAIQNRILQQIVSYLCRQHCPENELKWIKCAYSNTGNAVCKVSYSFRELKNANILKPVSQPLKELE